MKVCLTPTFIIEPKLSLTCKKVGPQRFRRPCVSDSRETLRPTFGILKQHTKKREHYSLLSFSFGRNSESLSIKPSQCQLLTLLPSTMAAPAIGNTYVKSPLIKFIEPIANGEREAEFRASRFLAER